MNPLVWETFVPSPRFSTCLLIRDANSEYSELTKRGAKA